MELVIHGGFSRRREGRLHESIRRALLRVLEEGLAFLERHSALDTVVQVVALLEDDPLFNAGTGSKVQADGVARMSAAVMDGARRRFSGVVNLERVRNPVRVARALQEEEYTVLAGEGARAFARSLGFPDYDPVVPETGRLREEGTMGTVGACALDRRGRLAVATSTGGRGMERPGRVSDSATVAGTYADERAAVSCTGIGEDIVDEALAVRLSAGDLAARFPAVFEEARRRGRSFGAIGLDAAGRVHLGSTEGTLFYAYRRRGEGVTF